MAGIGPVASFPVASIPVSAGSLTVVWTVQPQNVNTGQVISWQATASGGTSPYTYSVGSGSLPDGLSLNTSTGAITGTVTAANGTSFTFVIHAVDNVSEFGDTPSASVSVFDPAFATGKITKYLRRYSGEYRHWHKPWYPPPRSKFRYISVNFAPSRVTWDGAEIAYFTNDPSRVTWVGAEIASRYEIYGGVKNPNLYQIHGVIYRPRTRIRQKKIPIGAMVSILYPPTPIPSPPKRRVKRKIHPPRGIRPPIAAAYIAVSSERVTWAGAEIGYVSNEPGYVTWAGAEVSYAPNEPGYVTWAGAEISYLPSGDGYVTWSGAEVSYAPNEPARVSWSGFEIATPAVAWPKLRIQIFVTA